MVLCGCAFDFPFPDTKFFTSSLWCLHPDINIIQSVSTFLLLSSKQINQPKIEGIELRVKVVGGLNWNWIKWSGKAGCQLAGEYTLSCISSLKDAFGEACNRCYHHHPLWIPKMSVFSISDSINDPRHTQWYELNPTPLFSIWLNSQLLPFCKSWIWLLCLPTLCQNLIWAYTMCHYCWSTHCAVFLVSDDSNIITA